MEKTGADQSRSFENLGYETNISLESRNETFAIWDHGIVETSKATKLQNQETKQQTETTKPNINNRKQKKRENNQARNQQLFQTLPYKQNIACV